MLRKLVQRSAAFDELKVDYGPGPANQHRFDPETAHLIVPSGMFGTSVALPLTDHAFIQVCDRLGASVWPGSGRRLPNEYLLRCSPELRAGNLNHWLDRTPPDRQWFVRGFGERCRAVLTDQYTPVPITKTLKWAQTLVEDKGEGNCEFPQAYVTPDVCHVKMIFKVVQPPDTDQGPYGLGVYVSNGEIGNRKCVVTPLVKKFSCNNSIFGLQEGAWHHIHKGSLELLEREFLLHMSHAFDASEQTLIALLAAEEKPIPDFQEQVERMCKKNRWTDVTKAYIFQGAGTRENVASLVDGITFAAQQLEGDEDRIDMEMLASEFLVAMTKRREGVLVR